MSPSYDKDFTDMGQLYTHLGKPGIEAQLPEWVNSATTQQTLYAKGTNATPIHILHKLLSLQILCVKIQNLCMHLMNIKTLHFLSLNTLTCHINKVWF